MLEIVICDTCQSQPAGPKGRMLGAQLHETLRDAGLSESVSIRYTSCMNACDDPIAIALQDATCATYVFAGILADGDQADIVETCRAYLNSPGGWIEDARVCGRLRDCLKARVPAIQANKAIR